MFQSVSATAKLAATGISFRSTKPRRAGAAQPGPYSNCEFGSRLGNAPNSGRAKSRLARGDSTWALIHQSPAPLQKRLSVLHGEIRPCCAVSLPSQT